MPLAPVVIRYGHTVWHCSDPAMLSTILEQVASLSATAPPAASSQAFAAHEAVLSFARRHCLTSIGAITSLLAREGHAPLAKRIRAAARIRGAHAQLDESLADELEAVLSGGMESEPPDVVEPPCVAAPIPGGHTMGFDPTALKDDRLLRRPKAVKPPPAAAPSGGENGSDRVSQPEERFARMEAVIFEYTHSERKLHELRARGLEEKLAQHLASMQTQYKAHEALTKEKMTDFAGVLQDKVEGRLFELHGVVHEQIEEAHIRSDGLDSDVLELRAAEAQRHRQDAGMMYFAKSTQSRIDEVGNTTTELVTSKLF